MSIIKRLGQIRAAPLPLLISFPLYIQQKYLKAILASIDVECIWIKGLLPLETKSSQEQI